ncbi:MAG TPA: hypothetical protein VN706_17795 [Gemmatimonadaceae bacterium]|nr:hypothetical protein [Gemmatimonadaceae bacterium]
MPEFVEGISGAVAGDDDPQPAARINEANASSEMAMGSFDKRPPLGIGCV